MLISDKNDSKDIQPKLSITKQNEFDINLLNKRQRDETFTAETDISSNISKELTQNTEEENQPPKECENMTLFFEETINKYEDETTELLIDRGYWFENTLTSSDNILNNRLGDYGSYSDETLHQLAEQGDGKASMMLTFSSPERSKNEFESETDNIEHYYQKTIKYAYNATVDGYSAGILVIVSTHLTQAKQNVQTEQEHFLDALAWGYVARKRNDPLSILLETLIVPPVEFTQEDKKLAMLKAETIYAELEERRQEKGLPPFDNSYPEFLEPVYSCLKTN